MIDLPEVTSDAKEGSLKGHGDLRGFQRPQPPPQAPRSYQLKCPGGHWGLAPGWRFSGTAAERQRRLSRLERVRLGGSRGPGWKTLPTWTPRPGSPSFHHQPVGLFQHLLWALGTQGTEERAGLWGPAGVATTRPRKRRQAACCIPAQRPSWWDDAPCRGRGLRSASRAREAGVLPAQWATRSGLSWGHCDRRWGREETARPGVVIADPGRTWWGEAKRQFSSVQSLSCVRLFATLWTATRQPSLSITNSWSLLKLMSIKSVMPSNQLILCRPLLLPSIPPSIRVFSSESALHIRWPKYLSFSFSISPSNEYSGLISFKMDWLDLLAVQETLNSLLQHHSWKASIFRRSAFFIVQLSFQL